MTRRQFLFLVLTASLLVPVLQAQDQMGPASMPKTAVKAAKAAPSRSTKTTVGEAQVVPKPIRRKPVPPKKAKKIPYEKRTNLNRASLAELKKLPGMTDEYAQKIIAGRRYRVKTELLSRQVIPTTIYYAIKDRVTAGK